MWVTSDFVGEWLFNLVLYSPLLLAGVWMLVGGFFGRDPLRRARREARRGEE